MSNTLAIEDIVDEYVDGYMLEGDDGSYTPTETERLLIKDAVMGLLATPEFIDNIVRQFKAPQFKVCVRYKDRDVYVFPSERRVRLPGDYLDITNKIPEYELDKLVEKANALRPERPPLR